MTKVAIYTEPETIPPGCVRVRWKGKGKARLDDFRGWTVNLKEGQSLVVTREKWENMTNPDLPGGKNWELVE